MNIYLRTILSVPALLVFIIMWIIGSLIEGVGKGLVTIGAAWNWQGEQLLDWINPARRAYEHKPLSRWIEPPPQHPNCRCDPLDRSCPYVGGRKIHAVHPTSVIIGVTDFPEVDKEAFIEAIDALEDEDSGWPGGWL
ncbi:hypothetical protein LCGC14_1560740 [marine sediment metagenome]|uniref:Uncharacterized protein n=1 Tax=marine sediment metagenome TaxID=412755 RepID=A0A0F9IMJ5_9ZZZZ